MELSVVIVNKDTPKITTNAVYSAIKTINKTKFEVVVVDNSKNKDNVLSLNEPNVKIIKDVKNKGFSNACNIGAKAAKGEFLLFLNSDTVLFKDTVEKALNFFKQQSKTKKIGALGVRQLLENGRLDAGCKRGFPTPLNSLYYFLGLSKLFPNSKRFGAYQQTFVDEKETVEVDCISGAFMLIKKEVFNLIGGFDEDYFLYGEDVDLCYRLKQKEFKNIYYGKVSFLHFKGQSSKKDIKALESFYKSMEIFYKKHYKKHYCLLIYWLVKLGIFLKFCLAKIKFKRNKTNGWNFTSSLQWGKIFKRAAKFHFKPKLL